MSPAPQTRHGRLLPVHETSQPRPGPAAKETQWSTRRPAGADSQPTGSGNGAAGSEESVPVKACRRHPAVMSRQAYT
jgi:hypothetical protein